MSTTGDILRLVPPPAALSASLSGFVYLRDARGGRVVLIPPQGALLGAVSPRRPLFRPRSRDKRTVARGSPGIPLGPRLKRGYGNAVRRPRFGQAAGRFTTGNGLREAARGGNANIGGGFRRGFGSPEDIGGADRARRGGRHPGRCPLWTLRTAFPPAVRGGVRREPQDLCANPPLRPDLAPTAPIPQGGAGRPDTDDYADQAHLIREFCAFAEITPGAMCETRSATATEF